MTCPTCHHACETVAEVAILEAQIVDLQERIRSLRTVHRQQYLDGILDQLPTAVITALREPFPRAKDLRLLATHRLAYSVGGSSRYWTRELGEPLRHRLAEREQEGGP